MNVGIMRVTRAAAVITANKQENESHNSEEVFDSEHHYQNRRPLLFYYMFTGSMLRFLRLCLISVTMFFKSLKVPG